MYNKTVLDHFQNPRNVGKLENPSAKGEVGNPACGDMMYMYLKIKRNRQDKEYIDDIKFNTFGCGAAIATSSMLTEIAKGKTLEELLAVGETKKQRIKVLKDQIISELGELPSIKIHCSILAADALYDAIDNYYGIQKEEK
ncbi:MAG: iron-sulfur cluster assembly scaffold protein [Nanoarchaeota archaeon]|nr:iron-sulfur cluster assembly scaffold protein [Nanoarchaeota archaeon]